MFRRRAFGGWRKKALQPAGKLDAQGLIAWRWRHVEPLKPAF